MSAAVYDELTEVAERAVRAIRARRNRVARRRILLSGFWVLLAFPLAYAVFELIRFANGQPANPLQVATVAVWSIGVALAWIAFGWVTTLGNPVSREDALATLDSELGLQGRLLTADEFLQAPSRTPFMEAAIQDAHAHVEAARSGAIALEPAPMPGLGRRWMGGIAAVAVAALAIGLAHLDRSPRSSADPGLLAQAPLLDRDPVAADDPNPLGTPPPAAEPPGAAAERLAPSEDARGQASEMESEDVKQSRGTSGAGQAAEASAAQGSGRSQASPSNQGQSSKEDPKTSKARPPKNPPESPPAAEPPKRKPEEEAGATTGRGASKGSNKNPSTSDWNSRDHVAAPDEKSMENDEDIEDEDEEQESRGGIQPNLRDRKPPVNRDLRIGFGNRKNPDANGRGGPSEQKKSRGVASLVLGVPIPDRIKGQPNPGKTKITQERIEPRAETAERIAAEARAPRTSPFGPVARRPVPKSLRGFVKNYFLSLRQQPIRP